MAFAAIKRAGSAKYLRFSLISLMVLYLILYVLIFQTNKIDIKPCENCTQSVLWYNDSTFEGALRMFRGKMIPETVKAINSLGQERSASGKELLLLLESKKNISGNTTPIVLQKFEQIRAQKKKIDLRNLNVQPLKTNITIGMLVCGTTIEQSLVLLKSAVMFSLDANLHVVIVSDADTILTIGQHVLSLKLGLNEIGYSGFTFELHLEWYPHDTEGPDWKAMYRVCATQRLFFPTLLKEHDALIYLDTDVVILSNLTEMWEIFRSQMTGTKFLGVTPNTEIPGVYNPSSRIPYYGSHGINAGVMLMNLTQLREFNLESRARATYTVYDVKIQLADQDIINVILHAFPERAVDIGCTYNFYWVHCDISGYECLVQNRTKNICFCNQVQQTGVRILHGNTGTFWHINMKYPFVNQIYTAFRDLDLFADSYGSMFKTLRMKFNELHPTPCFPLTADGLYGNAEKYLRNLHL